MPATSAVASCNDSAFDHITKTDPAHTTDATTDSTKSINLTHKRAFAYATK